MNLESTTPPNSDSQKKRKKTIREFCDSRHYLPRFMRDFHDQKDLFKGISEFYKLAEKAAAAEDLNNPDCIKHHHLKGYSWVLAHVYVIDFFLWFMAHHGYTLQKSRAPVEFCDIDATIEMLNEKRCEETTRQINEFLGRPKEATE